jgi:hypothetical protein
MQSRRNPHNNGLREPAPPSRRALAAREAMLRVTMELLQAHVPQTDSVQETYPLADPTSNEGHPVEVGPTQASTSSIAGQKMKLLGAIRPVLEVVADSNVVSNWPGSDSQSIQSQL